MPAGLNVVILAAGQGKRMHSRLPKVLHPLAGRPLLAHVIATARALKPARICVVYGHGGEQVPQAVAADDLVIRPAAAATRHRTRAAAGAAASGRHAACTLVLYGDVPLIGEETLAAMIAGGGDRLTLLTAELDDPAGYGRIVRNRRGIDYRASSRRRTRAPTQRESARSTPASWRCPPRGSRTGCRSSPTATRSASTT